MRLPRALTGAPSRGGALSLPLLSALTFNLMEIRSIPWSNSSRHANGKPGMLGLVVMRAALQAMSMLFGGLGMFFLYHSFWSEPAVGASPLIFIGSASAIVWSLRVQQTGGR